jgi:hypothetical protein
MASGGLSRMGRSSGEMWPGQGWEGPQRALASQTPPFHTPAPLESAPDLIGWHYPIRGGPIRGGPIRGGPIRGRPIRGRRWVTEYRAAWPAQASERDGQPSVSRLKVDREWLGGGR